MAIKIVYHFCKPLSALQSFASVGMVSNALPVVSSRTKKPYIAPIMQEIPKINITPCRPIDELNIENDFRQ